MSDELDTHLLRCREWIEDALEYSGGTHCFDDVADGVRSGRMQLWQGPEGCAVTEIVVYPRSKALHVFLAGGKMEQIIDMIDSAVEWGRAVGCDTMTVAGRPGWERVLQKYGWHYASTILAREI